MKEESLPVKVVKKKPILVGYIAAVVTIELAWKIAEWVGWIR